jgi:hypothetical protein
MRLFDFTESCFYTKLYFIKADGLTLVYSKQYWSNIIFHINPGRNVGAEATKKQLIS